MIADLKMKYKTDFKTVQKLVNSFDPCGLIKGGAPKDEYDVITNKILSSIYNKRPRQEIVNLIVDELVENFWGLSLNDIKEPLKIAFLKDLNILLNAAEFKINRQTF
jgi:hypothetical protein